MQVILTGVKGIYERIKRTNNRNTDVTINFKYLITGNRIHEPKVTSAGSGG